MMPFIIFTFAFALRGMNINVDPIRYEAILDETGLYADGIKQFDTGQLPDLNLPDLGRVNKEDLERVKIIDPPGSDIDENKLYLTGVKTLDIDGQSQKLSALLHLYKKDGVLKADFWSENISNTRLKRVAQNYFRDSAANSYMLEGSAQLNSANNQLEITRLVIEQVSQNDPALYEALQSGNPELATVLNPTQASTTGEMSEFSMEGLRAAEKAATKVTAFDPSKSAEDGDQSVTLNDRIPALVTAAATVLLWLTIFSGAYMLLTSMLEEKLNKLLEMMLSTTRLSEIMVGKLLGIAALTITAMMPYIVLMIGGSVFLSMFNAEVAAAILGAVTPKLIVFFFVFLVLGYTFYGALFIAVGSLAESMQDAQTLTTPIMLILTACVMVVPLGLNSPDSPLLTFASWFPLSAPFGALARLPQDPPWWELALSAFFLFLLSVLVIWLAGRILRFGVLSGAGVKGALSWFKRVIFRRKAS